MAMSCKSLSVTVTAMKMGNEDGHSTEHGDDSGNEQQDGHSTDTDNG